MALDFGKINSGLAAKKQIDPRKIFTTLKRDTGKFKRPSDEQGDVLDAWLERKDRTDNTLKMNTGSGKTVVGLLCLQSSLNDGAGPSVYITPDNYLVNQVIREAKSLGISATKDENDGEFLAGESILVINITKLVNGRSVFGVGQEGIKINIGSMVIDDAHACLATVADQFKITLPSTHPAYGAIFALFKDSLENQSFSTLLDVEAEDPQAVMQVPYWAWIDRQKDVLSILHPSRTDDTLKWPWKLLVDVLPICQAAFGGGVLEIAPRFIPIDVIPAFTGARRRIYMTATLADDGILVTHFQANPESVIDPIRPKGGGDIGDRMILAPQEITPSITTEEIKQLAAKYAKEINVSVIVPSRKRAEFWEDVANQVLTAENMEKGTAALRAGHVGLTVFVAKYDGVDLPAAACHLLLIDGLPEVTGLLDKIEQTRLDGTRSQLVRQIQRIEQGMGRGVRSSEDHCVVLLLGSRLTQRLHRPEARDMFSVATRAQLDLGREVTTQLKGKPLSEIEEVIDLCLNRDDNWIESSRNAVVNAEDSGTSHLDNGIVHLREAFDYARSARYDKSIDLVQRAINDTNDPKPKGYLKQQLAEYQHQNDPLAAQETQLSAVQLNRRLLRPMKGVTYSKLDLPKGSQALAASEFVSRFLEKNEMLLWVNALTEALVWGEENTKRFEAAIYDLGRLIGFGSQRPEEDVGKGPDNLWALGQLRYLVIECKSGATDAQKINKHDCNQLNGSVTWFYAQYDGTCQPTPVMVHQKLAPEFAATLHPETRIINADKLNKLISAIRNYSIAIGSSVDFRDAKLIAPQLVHFELSADAFVSAFTVKPKIS